jgi:hypothetical protein
MHHPSSRQSRLSRTPKKKLLLPPFSFISFNRRFVKRGRHRLSDAHSSFILCRPIPRSRDMHRQITCQGDNFLDTLQSSWVGVFHSHRARFWNQDGFLWTAFARSCSSRYFQYLVASSIGVPCTFLSHFLVYAFSLSDSPIAPRLLLSSFGLNNEIHAMGCVQ